MSHYEAQRTLPYPREALFDLAADVERYPEFLPGWTAARIRRREGDLYHTDQVIAFGPFRAQFGSETRLERPERIAVRSNDRMFRTFRLDWRFEPQPDGTCRVTVSVDIALRSRLAQELFGRTVRRMADTILSAFETRAHRLCGPARRASRNARSAAISNSQS
ncbi:MAG TPA: type II toxin-antitoxin system RatA family toxin [Kiloniellales bacterium]|nr:type II toxin-antitoxin system RatA family toxin [Kiloniellales bacterium]